MKPCKYILEIHKNIVENHITGDDFKEEIIKAYFTHINLDYQIYGISFGFIKYRSCIIDFTRNYGYNIRFTELTE
jgi:hypothetical protein